MVELLTMVLEFGAMTEVLFDLFEGVEMADLVTTFFADIQEAFDPAFDDYHGYDGYDVDEDYVPGC